MIELTTDQVRELNAGGQEPPVAVDPRTKIRYVLLRADEYSRLTADYDDSPWSRAELDAAAWETAERAGWDESDPTDTRGSHESR